MAASDVYYMDARSESPQTGLVAKMLTVFEAAWGIAGCVAMIALALQGHVSYWVAMLVNGVDITGWPGGLVSAAHGDAEVEETEDRADRILGVDGGVHEVAGHGGLHRDGGGFFLDLGGLITDRQRPVAS